MPSPFPGMNPYLERDTVWSDFHSTYCLAMKKALVPQVQPEFYVKLGEHIYLRVSVQVPTFELEERVPYLEVFDKEDHTLVTVIELLSPSNKKMGDDRDQFLHKRRQLFRGSVQYVEIDLLRGGRRLPIRDMPACDYYVLVSRAENRPDMGLWPIKLREPLPVIPIPLPEPKLEVRLALQELLHQAYDEAGYATYVYDGALQPRLRKDDAKWARRFYPGK